ncbi:MAG TPA: choice-of-anchor L domain-containing protein [Verrucomicrobiae bacterium]|nr:choice-of-anchor L domain-containing protein [Verrucomicrobiae bacterium]
MKLFRTLLAGMVVGGGLMVGPHRLHAQQTTTSPQSAAQDSIVQLTADAQGLAPAAALPKNGTFWVVTPGLGGAIIAPAPCPPVNPNLPVYAIAPGQFLVDGTGGRVVLNNRFAADSTVNSALEAQAAAVVNLIQQVQAVANGMMLTPNGYPGGITNIGSVPLIPRPVYTTNDLWLELTEMTNAPARFTVYLTIHKPASDTNLFHDLYFNTDLAESNWSFAMRCPYTNAVVPALCSPDGFFWLGPATNGNLIVTNDVTPLEMARMLVPSWVVVTNVTYTGADVARGTFAGGNGCGLPIDSGVILSSGNISDAIGPNNSSSQSGVLNGNNDPDLDKLVGGSGTDDAAVLEFDIISTNSFRLQFQYLFASEEYPEWINRYNDPMAIFVSTNHVGTNWINSITNDFALVPGTTNVPISVNTINGGCVDVLTSSTNPQYYVDNDDPNYSALPPYGITAPVFNVQYDGMTVLLTAQATISANLTNHVKIAIADYGDQFWDSAVFIKFWSPNECQ